MILNVYKEKGWTSFDVVAKLRGILKTKKIGHAGTLDPLAEGVLIVLTSKDTKKQDEYMHQEKEYLAEIAFGCTSKTYDLEGPLTFTNQTVAIENIKKNFSIILKKYIGTISQTVPAYSAVKVNGRKLYQNARSGKIDLEALPVKQVFVKEINVKNWEMQKIQDKELPVVTLQIVSGSGFYVRSLANDLGQDLGVGGVLISLKRIRVGDFLIKNAKKVSEVVL